MVEIKWPNIQGYSIRSSSRHNLSAMFHCMIFRLYCVTDYKIDYLCTHLWMRIVWSLLFCSITESLTFRGKWMPVRALPDPRGLVAPGDSARTPPPSSTPTLPVLCSWFYCMPGCYSTACIVLLLMHCFFLYNYLFSEFPVSLELPLYKLLKSFSDTCHNMCKLMFWCCLYL